MYSFGIICQEIMYRKGRFWLGPERDIPERCVPREIIERMFTKGLDKSEWQPFLEVKKFLLVMSPLIISTPKISTPYLP